MTGWKTQMGRKPGWESTQAAVSVDCLEKYPKYGAEFNRLWKKGFLAIHAD